MSKEDYKAGFNAGMALSRAAAGMSEEEFRMSKAASAVIREDRDAQVTLCKIAKHILSSAGETGTAYRIYDVIEKSAGAVSGVTFDTYLAPVLHAVAEAGVKDGLDKAAKVGIIPAAVAHTANLGSDAFKTLLAAAGLLGITGGGAWWAINRDPAEDDVETQLKRDQATYYKRLAKDLKRKVAQEEAKNPKIDATRKAVEDSFNVL